MDIDIILEPDLSPAQVAEIGVAAEKLGIRAVWSSNYHMNYDAFLALAPLATATSKILMGPLAVSPWEMHPLKDGQCHADPQRIVQWPCHGRCQWRRRFARRHGLAGNATECRRSGRRKTRSPR